MGENIDVLKVVHCTVDQIADASKCANVRSYSVGRTASIDDRFGDTINVCRGARVHDDKCAFPRKLARDGLTNPLPGARHDRDFAIQSATVRFIHRLSLNIDKVRYVIRHD